VRTVSAMNSASYLRVLAEDEDQPLVPDVLERGDLLRQLLDVERAPHGVGIGLRRKPQYCSR
jgi:hypothetical protein